MTVLPIVIGTDHPALRKKTQKVPKVTKKLLKLLRDMEDSMREANGVGLAAPQVGHTERVCIAMIGGKLTSLINPEITWRSDERATDEEGCLSLPGIYLPIPRSIEIALTYLDEKGKEQQRKLKDFDARVVQHEVDHLEGILIVDYAQSKLALNPA